MEGPVCGKKSRSKQVNAGQAIHDFLVNHCLIVTITIFMRGRECIGINIILQLVHAVLFSSNC